MSRNTYQQFDIGQGGAILNNSRTNAQTQIAGWVQGNPWLAGGSARIIVNEVNSAAQSRLMGPLEVAGQRADVIIANPSGLVVDGLSLINAAGVTLTTGRPLYGANGSLDGFRVQGGQISLQGSGMDATKADYANILPGPFPSTLAYGSKPEDRHGRQPDCSGWQRSAKPSRRGRCRSCEASVRTRRRSIGRHVCGQDLHCGDRGRIGRQKRRHSHGHIWSFDFDRRRAVEQFRGHRQQRCSR